MVDQYTLHKKQGTVPAKHEPNNMEVNRKYVKTN